MAVRGWGGSVATAIAAAGAAGAAQLGLGYGLGIVVWLPSADGASESTWVASLAWAAWIAATSTVIGSLCAGWLAAPAHLMVAAPAEAYTPAPLSAVLGRIALAVAAAIGALVTVALVAVPARAATRSDTFSPQTIAAGYAVIGVLLGLAIAVWALSSRAVARNVVATVCWLWVLAVVAVVDGVLSGRGLTAAQLGVWQITTDSERFWFRNYFYWPGAALSLGSALVIGALAARPAARHNHSRVGAAISGGVGPLLVAAAYFLAAPRLVGIRAEQVSAHLIAPYAVVAGLAGSVIVAAAAQRAQLVSASGRVDDPAGKAADVLDVPTDRRPGSRGLPAQSGARPAEERATGRVPPPSGATVPPPAAENSDRDPVRGAGRPSLADRSGSGSS